VQLSLFKVVETFKSDTLSACKKCEKSLPPEAYGMASGGNYRHTTCKKCSAHNAKVLQVLHQTTPKPPEDYTCPICLRSKEDLVSYKRPDRYPWCLDHHHEGEYFRGWLCQRCNNGIGLLNDSSDNAKRAMDYLNER